MTCANGARPRKDACSGAGSHHGPTPMPSPPSPVPEGLVLVAALAVADDGAIVVRTSRGLGLLRPHK